MAKKDNGKQIENMRKLGYSEEEIQEMLADDEVIEQSKTADKCFDWEMDVDEHKKAMKNANVGEKKKTDSQEKKPKTRKENPEKRALIEIIYQALVDSGYNAVITNPEKVIEFSIAGQDYSISLTAHRKKKD